MSKNKPENPQAFPELYINDPHLGLTCAKGMTLRDHFAGQAMQADISLDGCTVVKTEKLSAWTERWYKIADAMLKERENE